jgi:cardiolipin synthase
MLNTIPIATILFFGFGIFLSCFALLIVPRNRKPTAGMAWLLVIFLIPYLGWIIFLLLGTNKLPRNRRNAQEATDAIIDKRVGIVSGEQMGEIPDKYRSLAQLTTSLGHLPPLHGETTEFISDYTEAIERIVDDIKLAKINVYVEYYILTLDHATNQLFEQLRLAVERGVEVRVLYDWWGSRKYKGYRPMLRYMRQHHIGHQPMMPLTVSFKNYLRIDLRNHRKLVIIDHDVGYVGSQNMIKRNYDRKDRIVYDELVVRLTGTIINELKAIFAYDWSVESKLKLQHIISDDLSANNIQGESLLQILPSGPSYDDENNLKVFTYAINRAESEIFIANPYFVPAEPLLSAITTAVKRGVKVRMINSQAMDQWMVGHAQRSYYQELLDVGVNMYLYKKPNLLHSKFMLIDNEIALIGSSNLDIRSFELDQELSLILYTPSQVERLIPIRDKYLSNSVRLKPERWQKRSLRKQILDSIARLTSNIQ